MPADSFNFITYMSPGGVDSLWLEEVEKDLVKFERGISQKKI
jgi:hypothetical protein